MGGFISGGGLSGIGSILGGAGDLYQAFKKPPGLPSNQMGFQGQILAPGYSFGAGTLTRRNNDFLTGQRRLRDVIGGLRQQVTPGFGKLTESGVQAIRNKAAAAAGNLRSNLARRGLAGASFAEDVGTRMEAEYQQLENEFRGQAFQEELAATNQLLEQEQNSLLSQAQMELGELGIATSFLSSVKQVALTQKQIEASFKEEELMNKYFAEQQPAASLAPGAGETESTQVIRPAAAAPTPRPKPKPAPRPLVAPRPSLATPSLTSGFGGGRR